MRAGLPYFDILLDGLEQGKPGVTQAFGAHVHWGYWGAGDRVDDSVAGFAAAAERMSAAVAEAASARDGQRILDVGCGFGGTIGNLDRRLEDVALVGLNIDPRQLDRARLHVSAREGNTISFVEGDACALPFPDASFDTVLALECAFHFPSRRRFFAEAARVLRPGGRLAVSDFVPAKIAAPALRFQDLVFGRYMARVSGPTDIQITREQYQALGRDAGLRADPILDITENTLPTYAALRRVIKEAGTQVGTALFGAVALEAVSRLRLLRYLVLPFTKP
ncbi:MAG: class I SAM-dependent methyltransferase [Minicystis sp.]